VKPPDFLPFIHPFLADLGISLDRLQSEQIEVFCRKLLEDSFYKSVSKISSPEEIATKHILDSLIPLSFPFPCWENPETILDVGTGGGFPAIPLAIFFPKARVFALDSKGKAIDFVCRMKEAIPLKNLFPLLGRAEDLGQDLKFREKHDLVTCRAVSSIRVLVEICLPLARKGGFSLFYKGPKLDEELKEAKRAFECLRISENNLIRQEIHPPKIPFSRGFVLIHKTERSPVEFPRRNGLPAAKPL